MEALKELARSFRSMHEQDSIVVMPCAWDAFSAIVFEQAGFACIGTTSGGVNWVRGRRDYVYSTPAQEMLNAYRDIARATALPVSGDLENGYGETVDAVADTIRGAIAAGMVGGSIEDQWIGPTDDSAFGTLFDLDVAVQRIKSARAAADESGIAFTLTARCEVYYTDSASQYEVAVERLNAYREAGADCLFVPGLNDLNQLAQLVRDVNGPISFGMGATPRPITIAMLEDVGVRRVSTGGGITRAMLASIRSIASDLVTTGDVSYLDGAMSESDVNRVLDGARQGLDESR
ncbi:MAG: isocitrate lyase/phosphoenolpyruvate mutase family protein [Pseudomonadota bacterium]